MSMQECFLNSTIFSWRCPSDGAIIIEEEISKALLTVKKPLLQWLGHVNLKKKKKKTYTFWLHAFVKQSVSNPNPQNVRDHL